MQHGIRPLELIESDIRPPSWTVAWSDLMMVMFILFVVLFVFAAKFKNIPKYLAPNTIDTSAQMQVDEKAIVIGHSLDKPAQVDLGQLGERLAERLAVFEPGVTVRQDPDSGILVTLHGRLFFHQGSAQPTELAFKALDEIGASLIATRSFVTITAYADAKAIEGTTFDTPWELAALRSAKAAGYFTGNFRLEPERFAAQGLSLTPLVPVDSPLDRDRNERLEIWLTGRYR